jgi:hypothetical protein
VVIVFYKQLFPRITFYFRFPNPNEKSIFFHVQSLIQASVEMDYRKWDNLVSSLSDDDDDLDVYQDQNTTSPGFDRSVLNYGGIIDDKKSTIQKKLERILRIKRKTDLIMQEERDYAIALKGYEEVLTLLRQIDIPKIAPTPNLKARNLTNSNCNKESTDVNKYQEEITISQTEISCRMGAACCLLQIQQYEECISHCVHVLNTYNRSEYLTPPIRIRALYFQALSLHLLYPSIPSQDNLLVAAPTVTPAGVSAAPVGAAVQPSKEYYISAHGKLTDALRLSQEILSLMKANSDQISNKEQEKEYINLNVVLQERLRLLNKAIDEKCFDVPNKTEVGDIDINECDHNRTDNDHYNEDKALDLLIKALSAVRQHNVRTYLCLHNNKLSLF